MSLRVETKNNKLIDDTEKSLSEFSKTLLKDINDIYLELKPILSTKEATYANMRNYLTNNSINLSYENYNSDELKTIGYLTLYYRDRMANNVKFVGKYASIIEGKHINIDIIFYKKDKYLDDDESISYNEFLSLPERPTIAIQLEYDINIGLFTEIKAYKIMVQYDLNMKSSESTNGFDDGFFDVKRLQ